MREGELVVPTPIIELRDLRISVIDADLAASIGAFDEALTLEWVEVIPGVSLALSEGESLALVGESGSGKSLILMGGLELKEGLALQGIAKISLVSRIEYIDGQKFFILGKK